MRVSHLFLTIYAVLSLSKPACAQIVYNFPAFNGSVECMAEDASYLYVGGQFTGAGTSDQFSKGLLVVSTSGSATADNSFPGFDGDVNAIVADGNGGYYVGGSFGKVGGLVRNNLVHILSDKSVDANWNANASNAVYCIALSGSDLYVGGAFTSIGGQSRNYLAKLSTTTGVADGTWNPAPSNFVRCLLISGSDLYVGGEFSTSIGGQSRNRLAKVSTTGSGTADASWNPNVSGVVYALALSGSDLYFAGNFSTVGSTTRNKIAKIGTSGTGTLDATWNPNADFEIYSLLISGSDLYVGGFFNNIGGLARNAIAKLSTTGTGAADATWNPNGGSNGKVNAMALSGSDLYVSGNFSSIGGQSKPGFAKLSTSGSGTADSSWGSNGYSLTGSSNSLLVANNLVWIGATGSITKSLSKGYLIRINKSNNTIDQTWVPSLNGSVYSLALSGTDLYVGGSFSTVGGVGRNRIAKISTSGSGSADANWNPNATGVVYTLLVSGSDLYAGGTFSTIGGQARNKIAKLSTTGTGSADATWNPNSNDWVLSLALSGSDLYVGGYFSSIGGQSRNYIAKLSTSGTGSADATWNPNPNSSVSTILVSGSTLYVGGYFTTIGGVSRNYIAKLSTTGSGATDASWNPNASYYVGTMSLFGTDLYVGGGFNSSIGGQSRQGIARLNTDTGLADASWNPSIKGTISTLIQSGSNVYTGGGFTSLQDVTVYNFAVIPTSLKAFQTISFSLGSNANKTTAGPSFVLTGVASSGLNITYSSSNTAVATISGNTVNITGAGVTTITAAQAGDATYNAATNVSAILTVTQATITATEDPLNNEQLLIYPNPASDLILVQLPETGFTQAAYRIYDLQGSFITSGSSTDANFTIPIKSLQPGIHLLELHYNGKSVLHKILKLSY